MNEVKKRFYSQLKDHFVGNDIQGQSGYVNLLSLKSKYFAEIKPFLEREINSIAGTDTDVEKDLYDRLVTFFECYLNDTGTPFFAKTPPQKNLYERVYNDKDDVALFWKTQRLYYVKSEEDYKDLEVQPESCPITFKFKTGYLIRKQSNEKRKLQFVLTHHSNTELTIQALYEDNSQDKNNLLREYLKLDNLEDIRNKLIQEHGTDLHPSIQFIANEIDQTVLAQPKQKHKWLNIIVNRDTISSVSVLLAPTGEEAILDYLNRKHIPVTEEQLKEAVKNFKKQNVVDYFIHKDAEGFLKEQFNLYVYNWLFNDLKTEFDPATVSRMQNVKKAAYTVIEYIAKFEDELRAIWEKPKFVFNSNYVITLDRIAEKNISLVEKLLQHTGMTEQIKEWQELGIVADDFDPIQVLTNDKVLSDLYCKLPIDTKHFKSIELEVLMEFDELDESLDGWLIKSENYQALNTILPKHKDRVQTIYIDPPFNTGDDFSYIDKYQNSTWLSIMADRLLLSENFISKTGGLFLHLDWNAQHFGRSLLDSIFGDKHFVNEIIWRIGWVSGYKTAVDAFVRNHDTIFLYSKNSAASYYFKKTLSKIPYKNHKLKSIESPIDDIINAWGIIKGDIHNVKVFIKDKSLNVYKVGISDNEGLYNIEDTWNSSEYDELHSNKIKRNASEYTPNGSQITQKPEQLLKRIIETTTDEKHLVLDFFCGSGTTTAVAHKMRRRWIGIELGQYFYTDVLWRMKRTLFGIETGISKIVNHTGGGFFKYYELEQYEDVLLKSCYSTCNTVDFDKASFCDDQKLLYSIDIDYENKIAKIDFSKIYPDKHIDLAETLSNLSGDKIKRLTDKGCILCDRTTGHDKPEIDFSDLTIEKYPWLKPLIWWKSR